MSDSHKEPPKTLDVRSQEVVSRLLSGQGVQLRALPGDPPTETRIAPAAQESQEPEAFLLNVAGKYENLTEIARGGIGVVLAGRDEELGRRVAVKVLQERYLNRPEVVQRFIEEAQIAGQLQHPGIVPVYDLGTHDGRPFFAMKLIRGRTLWDMLSESDGAAAARQQLLTIFEAVCQTVGYAHARGVIHRDLKPANVMVGQFGEVQVVDWGMAKVLREGGAEPADPMPSAANSTGIFTIRDKPGNGPTSLEGAVLGTPAYMAPEQARGDTEIVDERSDVFSLGSMLCELLTGHPAYRGQGAEALLQASRCATEDAEERLAACEAHAELVQLTRDCLQADRERRPPDAAAVAKRLANHRAGIVDRAREAELSAAGARVRARATLQLAAAAVLLILIAGGAWLYVESSEREQRELATARVDELLQQVLNDVADARASGELPEQQLEQWDEIERLGQLAVEEAESGPVAQDRRDRARAQLQRIQTYRQAAARKAAERDRALAVREALETVRIPTDEGFNLRDWERRESRRQMRDYLTFFRSFAADLGLEQPDLRIAEPEKAAAALSGALQADLSLGLDLWALAIERYGKAGAKTRRRHARNLRAIAARLDGDDFWRRDLRQLVAARDRQQIVALANASSPADLDIDSTVLLAESLILVGAEKRASEVYDAGHVCHPDDFGICFRAGVLHAVAGRDDRAVVFFHAARALRPDRAEPAHLLGSMLGGTKRWAEALVTFEELCRKNPDDGHFLYHLGVARLETGDRQGAESALEASVRRSPRYAVSRLLLGQLARERGERDAALQQFREAIEVAPNSASAHSVLGEELLKRREYAEAEKSLRKAIELSPADVFNWDRLAQCLLATKQWRQVLLLADQARAANVEVGPVWIYAGDAHRALRQPDRARRLYEQVAKTEGFASAARTRLAELDLAEGATAAANEQLRLALEANPLNANAMSLAITLELDAGKVAAARSRAVQAIETGQAPIELLRSVGSVMSNRGYPIVAETAFRRVLERLEQRQIASPASDHYNLGNALMGQGRFPEASTEFRIAVRKQPRYPEASNNLALCLSRDGHALPALAVCDEAVRASPDNAMLRHLHARLGANLAKVGQVREDLVELRRLAANGDAEARPYVEGIEKWLRDKAAGQVALRRFVLGEADAPPSLEHDLAGQLAFKLELYDRALQLFEAGEADGGLRFADVCRLAARVAVRVARERPAAARPRLRNLALRWLRRIADPKIDVTLRRACTFHPDFEDVRGQGIEELPEEERAGWIALWKRLAGSQ